MGDDPVRLQGARLRRRDAAGRHVGLLYLESFIEPFGTLWFIYLLPMFFVVTKAVARHAAAGDLGSSRAALEMAHIATGWTVIDEFCARFVYFYSGYLFAAYVFALVGPRAGASRAGRSPASRCGRSSMAAWSTGRQRMAAGLAGARASPARCAIVTMGTLLARMQWLNFLRYCGEHSIVIYLAFFLPMAATRTLLLKTGLIPDIGTISLIVTVVGVVGALAIWRLALRAGANFLFERPAAFWIAPKKARPALQAAE